MIGWLLSIRVYCVVVSVMRCAKQVILSSACSSFKQEYQVK
jgi:hypothetical protein